LPYFDPLIPIVLFFAEKTEEKDERREGEEREPQREGEKKTRSDFKFFGVVEKQDRPTREIVRRVFIWCPTLPCCFLEM